jgi:hypothetical protein
MTASPRVLKLKLIVQLEEAQEKPGFQQLIQASRSFCTTARFALPGGIPANAVDGKYLPKGPQTGPFEYDSEVPFKKHPELVLFLETPWKSLE